MIRQLFVCRGQEQRRPDRLIEYVRLNVYNLQLIQRTAPASTHNMEGDNNNEHDDDDNMSPIDKYKCVRIITVKHTSDRE
jgi:hypothetical protein